MMLFAFGVERHDLVTVDRLKRGHAPLKRVWQPSANYQSLEGGGNGPGLLVGGGEEAVSVAGSAHLDSTSAF